MRNILTYFTGQCKVSKRNEKVRISGKGRERISSVFDTVNKNDEENWILRPKKKKELMKKNHDFHIHFGV